MKSSFLRGSTAVLAATSLLALAACSSETDTTTETTATSTSVVTTSSAAAEAGAVTLENCGNTITFESVPEHVMLINRAGVVPTIDALGKLDAVQTIAGAFPAEYFSSELAAKVDAIPNLTQELDATGHLEISQEEVVATGADLVIGFAGNVNHDAFASTDGIESIEEPGFCGALSGDATWEHVWDHVDFYGELFREEEQAETYKQELQDRLAAVEAEASGEGKTVAVLYPSTDGTVTYAYGTASMSYPITESAGLENLFGDSSERVFEVSAEEIISRNPDIIISLYSEGGEEAKQEAIDNVMALTGIEQTTAGSEGNILPLLLYFAEPASALSVDGLEILDDYLEGLN